MTPRSYSDYDIRDCAAEIASDCILFGKSDMWSGSIEDKERIEAILNPLNIAYTDDFFGEWAIVKPHD